MMGGLGAMTIGFCTASPESFRTHLVTATLHIARTESAHAPKHRVLACPPLMSHLADFSDLWHSRLEVLAAE